ncbi:FAD-binding oxidoreductase [Microbacterium gorillae]|uniref:FAD-binding oxidoreductase n=1 Tax=Microbacterium gorillae TaxID=1231063 RepID=UPI0005903F3C|nr:FAD-binding oxidoreductase [Microbacterium gorillae]
MSSIPGFTGHVIAPGDGEFETARRVYNLQVDVRPALIAQCATVADVQAVVRWAQEEGLPLAVRSAGNNYNGWSTSDGGVVVDLGSMRDVEIDAASRTARLGGGTRTGEVLTAASASELAPAIGVMSSTAVGLLLGGGFGHLRNRAGWSADNIIGGDLVTADGECIRVDTETNPDLLWALRGAGANFGVVTSLDLRLHSMPRVIRTGTMLWGEDRLEEGMRFLRDFLGSASEDLSVAGWLKLADDPDNPGAVSAETPPKAMRGRPCVEVTYCHWGAPEVAEVELAALRGEGRPDFESPGTTSYRDFHYRWEASATRISWDAVSVSSFAEDAITVLAATARAMTLDGTLRCVELFDQRGALSREGELASAQPRALPTAWSVRPGAQASDPAFDDINRDWVQQVMADVLATSVGIPDVCALNSASTPVSAERIRTHYGAGLPKLIELKRTWDPENVFRSNQNIDPSWALDEAVRA